MVDTKPCSCGLPGSPLTSRGCGATRKRWRPQGRIGDGLHGKGLIGDLRHHRALHRRQGQFLHRGMPGRLHLRGRPHALHPPRGVRGLRRLRARLPGGGHLLRGRRARPVEGLHARPTRPSSPRATSRSARPAGSPRSARWCATPPSSPTTSSPTANSPAHEPTWAGQVNGATVTGAGWRSTGASLTRRSRSRPVGLAGRRAARSSGRHVPRTLRWV